MVSKGLNNICTLDFYTILNSLSKQLKIIVESSLSVKILLRVEQASKSEMDFFCLLCPWEFS